MIDVRRWTLAASLVALSAGRAPCQTASAAREADRVTVIRAGALIDGVSAEPRANAAIVIRGNRIERVLSGRAATAGGARRGEAAADGIPSGPGVTTIDLSGATVLPGLIDTHTHIFLQGEDPADGGYDAQLLKPALAFRAARATVSARRALEQGFTTIRDMGTEGAGYGDVGIKKAIEAGYIPGPRIFTTGRAISTTGGYPLEGYAPEIERDLPKGVQIVDGPVEARKAAREHLDNGVDWLKVYMTHRSWLDTRGNLVSQPTLTVEELRAIVDEAHGQKKKVACHCYGGEGLRRALDGGCDTIEHGLDLDDASIAQMLRHGTWLVPTIAVYYSWWDPENTPQGKRDRKRAEVHAASFRRALEAGVKIAFGSDVGGFSWSDPIAREFARMVELGMSPIDAIRAATSRAAELLDMSGEIGVIAPGARADVIAVTGNPLEEIGALEHVAFVMKDGTVFKNELGVAPAAAPAGK